jgi:hypothetical protein
MNPSRRDGSLDPQKPTTTDITPSIGISQSATDPFLSYINNLDVKNLVYATKDEDDTSRTDTIPSAETQKIVKSFAEKYQTSLEGALAGITKLVQDGGTNSSKKQLKRTVNGIEFDINELRTTINFHYKSGTVRKLAKTLRATIARISSINNWPGPLVRDLQRLEPQLIISPQDYIFCCEIHADNYAPEMPAIIREALQRREQKIRDQNLTQNKSNKKGKKGKK